jgi:hypothetical protein
MGLGTVRGAAEKEIGGEGRRCSAAAALHKWGKEEEWRGV